MSFDTYTIIARIFPLLISAAPLIILSSFVVDRELSDMFKGFKWVGDVTLSVLIVYLLSQVNRLIAIELFEKKYFKDQMNMPTTNLLLHSDSIYSDEFKMKVRERVRADFKIELPTHEEELADEARSRKRIVEIVGLIRNKVGKGQLLIQHNIEYGFVRNLISGSVIGLIASAVDIYLFRYYYISNKAFTVSIITAVFFGAVLLLSKYLINRYGYLYAKRLFQEYLT